MLILKASFTSSSHPLSLRTFTVATFQNLGQSLHPPGLGSLDVTTEDLVIAQQLGHALPTILQMMHDCAPYQLQHDRAFLLENHLSSAIWSRSPLAPLLILTTVGAVGAVLGRRNRALSAGGD